MLKKTIKINLIVLLIMAVFLGTNVFAMSIESLKPNYTQESYGFAGFGKELLGFIRNIAIISAVVVCAFLGLKFMFGSLEQKAEYKKSLMPLAIGILVVAFSTTIVSTIWEETGATTGTSVCQHDNVSTPTCETGGVCFDCGKFMEYALGHQGTVEDGILKCSRCGKLFEV